MNHGKTRSTLVTGAAGFIGYHVAKRLASEGFRVVGVDNLNDYYDPSLKQGRLRDLEVLEAFSFERCAIEDSDRLLRIVRELRPDSVIHLAGQAGVRWSITRPYDYVSANLHGFLSVLEACRHISVPHLVYASSSSVYGSNKTLPFTTKQRVDHPVSLYAATKKANELMAHAYSHLYRLPTTGLRFFTVYGPWGRPDMAMWKFAKAICDGAPVELYNFGKMQRDFTYIDDIVEGVVRLVDKPPFDKSDGDSVTHENENTTSAPWKVYNIGNHTPVEIGTVIDLLEKAIGKTADRRYVEMQPGDVLATFADVASPATPIEEGVRRFADWFIAYREQAASVAGSRA